MAGIKHSTTKSSGDKGFSSDWNDDHVQTGNHNCQQYQFLNQVIENRTDFPAGPVEGQIIFRSDLNQLYIYNGSNWVLCTLNSKTSYLSIPGCAFQTWEPKVDNILIDADNGVFYVESGTNIAASCPVLLPHGAVVTGVIVYGYTSWTWYLFRDTSLASGLPTTMATAAVNTADTTISNATIDNQNYRYWIEVFPLDTDEEIDSVMITYTTLYD